MTEDARALVASAPAHLDEALSTLAADTWLPLAGGTDLVPRLRTLAPSKPRVLSLHGLRPELRWVALVDATVRMGALATLRDLASAQGIADRVPLLARAASAAGALPVQCRATVGGHVAAAAPGAELLPALLALDAEVVLASVRGRRRLPLEAFFTGYRRTARLPDELVVSVRAPLPPARARTLFVKEGLSGQPAMRKLVFAGLLETDRGVVRFARLAFGAVGSVPLRARRTEQGLVGERLTPSLVANALEILGTELRPDDDYCASAGERLKLARRSVGTLLVPPVAG